MNEKISCGIIEDLIPLYKENLCSDESRALVEEHIAECESCRALAESIEPPKVAELSDADEQKPFKKVNSKLKRSRLKVIILSVLLAVIALPLAFLTAGQMFRWNGWISFETIIQNFEAQRIADAFANGDIDLFADYLAYESPDAEKSFWDNYDTIVEKDKQDLKKLYNKAFKGLVLDKVSVQTRYDFGVPVSEISFNYSDPTSVDEWQGVNIGFRLYKTDYGKYNRYVSSIGCSPKYGSNDVTTDGYPNNDFGDFIRCLDFDQCHDINEYDSLETHISSDDPLGEFDNGILYSPAITYLGRYFASEDRDYIIQSMVAFFEKGYKILTCTVSDPCYDPDRQMLYYNFAVTAVDTDGQGLAVLQARMFYDYRGIYQPEVYSVAPNGCSAELINDMQHFFGYELDTPVLSSKLHDLTDAKTTLEEKGIRCKQVTGTNVATGEHDSELLTSFEDAAAASGVLLDIYGCNEEYECYIY